MNENLKGQSAKAVSANELGQAVMFLIGKSLENRKKESENERVMWTYGQGPKIIEKMKILNKQNIGAYASVMLDIMENNPSKENTKNIKEMLEDIFLTFEKNYRLNFSEDEKKEYAEVYKILDKLSTAAIVSFIKGEIIDFENDEMLKGLTQLVQLGKEA